MLSGSLTLKLMLKPAVNVTSAASNTICGVQLRAGVCLAQHWSEHWQLKLKP